MFEEQAKEYEERKHHRYEDNDYCGDIADGIIQAYQQGATFGYNKANEWHYVKDGDLPEVDNRIVLCICGDGYIDEKKHYILKLLTKKEFPLFQPVYAWREIILPEQEG